MIPSLRAGDLAHHDSEAALHKQVLRFDKSELNFPSRPAALTSGEKHDREETVLESRLISISARSSPVEP